MWFYQSNVLALECSKNFCCFGNTRKDKTSVIFKKLVKVGEPYNIGKKVFQRYAVFIKPYIFNDEFFTINTPVEDLYISIEIKQNKEDMEEKKLNLKPFDIQKAREGKTVCTRDGRKVRIICFDAKRKDEKNIIALVPSKDYPEFEDLIAYPNNGNYHGGHENDGDLMMLPEKKEGWVNVYHGLKKSEYVCGDIVSNTKEEAIQYAQNDDTYITTVKISWEE